MPVPIPGAPRRLIAIGMALAALLSAPCVHAEVTGTVQEVVNAGAPPDELRRRPLADAYVVITWWVNVPAVAHASTSCRHTEIARTDSNGRYVMKGPLLTVMAQLRVLAYAPGLERVPFPYPGTPTTEKDITLAPSARSPGDRLSLLASVYAYPGCGQQPIHDPHGLLKPYSASLLAEAQTLNVDTQAGRNALASLEASARRHNPGTTPKPRITPAQ